MHETLDSLRLVAGDFSRIKAAEGLAVSFALGQDRGPAQSSLCAFQDKKLKKNLVIVLGNAPLGIVVRDHGGSGGPGAASLVGHQSLSIREGTKIYLRSRGRQRSEISNLYRGGDISENRFGGPQTLVCIRARLQSCRSAM